MLDLLTTTASVVIVSNMNAELLLLEHHVLSVNVFVEMVVWKLPSPLPGSRHSFKYRLALVVDSACVLRYDNESGKGDHKHIGVREVPYVFSSARKLLEDFWRDVDKWMEVME